MQALRQALREAQPQIVQAVHKYALAGFDIPAISRQTQLSIDAVRDLVADSLPESMCEKLNTEYQEFAELLPKSGGWTYNHVLTARSTARVTGQAQQVDTISATRDLLLKRVKTLSASPSLSMQHAIQALKVIGVPQADNTQPAVSHKDNEAPAQYVYDDTGQLVDNPAYSSWRTKGATAIGGGGTVINIGAEVLRSLEDKADRALIADADGQVVGMHQQGGIVPLKSMSAEGLRQEVYGSTGSEEYAEYDDVDSDIDSLVQSL